MGILSIEHILGLYEYVKYTIWLDYSLEMNLMDLMINMDVGVERYEIDNYMS